MARSDYTPRGNVKGYWWRYLATVAALRVAVFACKLSGRFGLCTATVNFTASIKPSLIKPRLRR